ncbi:hypothetical protein LTR94_007368 [Friedmanniomyces endolithicus]|nr:hypothetical protein LTR94_007368 [Friedmanniomyces endolithicus]
MKSRCRLLVELQPSSGTSIRAREDKRLSLFCRHSSNEPQTCRVGKRLKLLSRSSQQRPQLSDGEHVLDCLLIALCWSCAFLYGVQPEPLEYARRLLPDYIVKQQDRERVANTDIGTELFGKALFDLAEAVGARFCDAKVDPDVAVRGDCRQMLENGFGGMIIKRRVDADRVVDQVCEGLITLHLVGPQTKAFRRQQEQMLGDIQLIAEQSFIRLADVASERAVAWLGEPRF